jgi:MFS transporter, FSR family, fosmidomycin resistance protein
VFILTLAAAAAARSFAGLLAAFVVFFPASGAFVSLTQSGLMDADPGRREPHMARWELAGSAGAAAGPFVLIAVLAAGGGWRSAFGVLAVAAAAAWLGVARNPPEPAPVGDLPARPGAASAAGAADATGAADGAGAVRRVLAALRRPGVARCLVLLQACDLLLDILTGFVALYLVDVVHASPEQAAFGVAIRLGAGLAGDAALVWALRRAGGLNLLRASAATAAVLYPGFLLAPGIGLKLLLLGGLSFATAPWYPMLQARLYGRLPDSSGIAVSLSSAAGLLGGAGPLAVGFLAQRFGLTWALAGLAAAPWFVLGGLWRWPPGCGDDGAPDAGRPGAGGPSADGP